MTDVKRDEIVIREAETRDIDGIAPLCQQLGYPCTSKEIAQRIDELMKDEDHIILVAVDFNGKIVGWVHSYISKLFYADKAAEIGGIVVDEHNRRYGAGKKLMEAVEDWAKSTGCLVVSLRSNSMRVDAHSFYNTIGYNKVKEQYTFRKYL